MAAVKRSQANQRRQPENFQLYHQQQQQQQLLQQHQQSSSSSSISVVKVELQTLILSILDDPIVSRVFSEAGFRSFDIKLAILRPVHHQLVRYSRYKGPPTFLCNLPTDSELPRRSFSFPFSGFSEVFNGDDNCRRIGEILVRNKGRNPLLIGVCAIDTLIRFLEIVDRNCGGVLPIEISGMNVISIQSDILKFVTENYNEELLKLRYKEVGRIVENCMGPGVIISYGDLRVLIGDKTSVANVSYVVDEMTRLLDLHPGKVWLIGAMASYETYLKFSTLFPEIDKNWDIQLLPITSHRPSVAESYSRSSLMESFVPLGGFFSTTSDLKSPISSSYQYASRCHLCNEKCEQEITAVLKGGLTSSVADHYQSILPSWLQKAELGTDRRLEFMQAGDGNLVVNAKVMGLRRKWDSVCQHLHHYPTLPQTEIYQVASNVPVSVGFEVTDDKKEITNNDSKNNANASLLYAGGCKTIKSNISMHWQNVSSSNTSIPLPGVSEVKDGNVPSKTEDLEPTSLRSPPTSFSNSSICDDRASPASAASVTTELGLGVSSASTVGKLEKPTDQPSSCFCPDLNWPFDQRDFKTLYKALSEKISWQEEAVNSICQTIARCRTRNQKCYGSSMRGDIWFNFLGPDRFGKKRTAIALAEILYGSSDNCIYVDLSSESETIHSKKMHGYDVMKFRGKTVVDYIAGELSRNPLSVVFLEDIDNADTLTQNSLSQAVRTGRFPDSHGKDVSINNAVFVTTSEFQTGNQILSSTKETSYFSEEIILRAKGSPIQILISSSPGDRAIRDEYPTSKGILNRVLVNKRKLIVANETMEEKRAHKISNLQLDLNLPAEEKDSISENSNAWLEDFIEKMDEMVVFRSFDFDTLAEKILKGITECFHKIVGWDYILEVESEVMEQIVANACQSEISGLQDWIHEVLCRGFLEAQKRYNLTIGSVVKLVCTEAEGGEQTQGILLPLELL